jgi:hypothetical protein
MLRPGILARPADRSGLFASSEVFMRKMDKMNGAMRFAYCALRAQRERQTRCAPSPTRACPGRVFYMRKSGRPDLRCGRVGEGVVRANLDACPLPVPPARVRLQAGEGTMWRGSVSSP